MDLWLMNPKILPHYLVLQAIFNSKMIWKLMSAEFAGIPENLYHWAEGSFGKRIVVSAVGLNGMHCSRQQR